MEYIILIIAVVCAVMNAIILIKTLGGNSDKNNENKLSAQFESLSVTLEKQRNEINDLRAELNNTINARMSDQRQELGQNISALSESVRKDQSQLRIELRQELSAQSELINNSMREVREETIKSLDKMREDNKKSLDEINGTVNEKLQKTLNDRITQSFETVNKRLEEVYKGLGEMKAVAGGVADLKNVLSNVKTRGTMGELQLDAILSNILSPEQYAEQKTLVPGSREKVDFTVILPGKKEHEPVYLPIDSKFPGDTYAALLNAYESGNTELIKQKKKDLSSAIKTCAKSISEKYISPPYTTDFAIMFLPFEGLYSEVVNMGLIEELQNKYKINITGPSTMAAMLNSLRMGFRTLAIQKKSDEVWKILAGTKKAFEDFEDVLSKHKKHLQQAEDDLDALIGKRTNAINKALRGVSAIDDNTELLQSEV